MANYPSSLGIRLDLQRLREAYPLISDESALFLNGSDLTGPKARMAEVAPSQGGEPPAQMVEEKPVPGPVAPASGAPGQTGALPYPGAPPETAGAGPQGGKPGEYSDVISAIKHASARGKDLYIRLAQAEARAVQAEKRAEQAEYWLAEIRKAVQEHLTPKKGRAPE